jgi:hypothetical protein
MDWELDNLTPRQEVAIEMHGYVGAFQKVYLPRLLKMDPPKPEPMTPQPELQIENPYVPLAHRK